MPNIKSAIKRVKINEEKNAQNIAVKSAMRTAVKKFELAVDQNEENAKDLFKSAVKHLDKAATKGLIHKNTANRQKARLATKLSKMA
ncbi:30S ribosomal protein S20 [Lederbergia citrea]|uniref:Small ribosomal subunit protein bS20 n=1 Tax=Lederbergia citrea TaxID=2833581 RepID=A0A942Z543_9BACI|nr:30S ribosomal protein S20 [Lederbergia citrea]MBS4176276.1 30S ribosomal protein S20 [Lederbergia citrea]MBS4202837.1 30S ribosomal protein S20 [Lederbergia citrea]MBS4222496.1 30S ribosomal protein S20 [Lederbergia citrea]